MQPEAIVAEILATAAGSASQTEAAGAVTTSLVALRSRLQSLTFDGPARLLTYSPPSVTAGESVEQTTTRLRFRLNDLHLAKTFGDETDVRRVIDETLAEVRTAALGRFRS